MLAVKLFAQARQLAGNAEVTIPWSDGQSVQRLKESLGELFPKLLPLIPKLLVAVNNNYADLDSCICQSDEVACFPPVSGG